MIWDDNRYNNGTNRNVIGQHFSAAGAKIGGEFQVNTTTAPSQVSNVVTLSNGGFVVTWSGVGPSGGGGYAQRYDANGALVGAETYSAPAAMVSLRCLAAAS